MKLLDWNETVLVIVGTGGTAPDRDRRLADSLRDNIDRRGDGLTYRRALVLTDQVYLARPELHRHPTIAIGGPGVNAVSQFYAADLPTVWQDEQRCYVQAELDGATKRVAVWGTNAGATAQAVDAFVSEGILESLLERIWKLRPDRVM
jgi:hypothetical protein